MNISKIALMVMKAYTVFSESGFEDIDIGTACRIDVQDELSGSPDPFGGYGDGLEYKRLDAVCLLKSEFP